MTITLASFLGITLSRLATGVVKESQRRALRAADEAAAQARIEERDGRLADVDRRARPLLERIASGAALDVAARRECVLLEAELRDSIRAARLSVEPVPSAARAARDRGVDVVLLDDRSKPMPPNLAHQVREAVAHELGRAHDGTVTVRLPPEGRATVATIVADTSEGYRSIEVDSG